MILTSFFCPLSPFPEVSSLSHPHAVTENPKWLFFYHIYVGSNLLSSVLLKDALTFGQVEIRIKTPTLQLMADPLCYHSSATMWLRLVSPSPFSPVPHPPPFSVSPCSLLCLSSSAVARHRLSRTPWSQRFLLLMLHPGGLGEPGAPVGHLPSMHLGWKRRKRRKWWSVWRSGEKVRRRKSPRSVLGSDDDAGGLKEQIRWKKTHHQSLSHLVLNTVALKLSYSFIKYPHFSNLILTIPYQYMLNNYTKEVFL